MPNSVKQLATALPDNLCYLSGQIARKPAVYTHEWVATADEAFSLYTRTSTVNLILSWNNLLAEAGWPFPAFLDLREEVKVAHWWPISARKLLWSVVSGKGFLRGSLMLFTLRMNQTDVRNGTDAAMIYIFWRHSRRVFDYWLRHPLLAGQEPIVHAIRSTFRKRLWAACVPTTLPLLDLIMRNYFETNRLNVSLQTLRDAFEKAQILPKHLAPGYGVWDLTKEATERSIFTSVDHDLRLPGVFLASFVDFGSRYYAWYRTQQPSVMAEVNRHAIIHCATSYWSMDTAVKLLVFLDLTLHLERVLKMIIHGPPTSSAIAQPAGA